MASENYQGSQSIEDYQKQSWITSLFAGLVTLIGNVISNEQQKSANKEMSEINLQNQKSLLDYQAEQSQNFNTIATQKGHAAAAGFSPALLYGQMSTPGLYDSGSASNTGEAPNLDKLHIFDRIPVSDHVQMAIQRKQTELNAARTFSDIQYQNQLRLESAAKTAEQMRDTRVKKSLEKTIIDQSLANLHLTYAQRENFAFQTERGRSLLPYEMEQAGLINDKTSKEIERLTQQIVNNPIEMANVRASTGLLREQTELFKQDKKVAEQSIRESQERVRRSAVGRIMSEMGLNRLKIPPSSRIGNPEYFHQSQFYIRHKEQINGALSALLKLGFDPDEASLAVVLYCNDNNVDAGVVSGLSRVASSLIRTAAAK